MANEDIIAAKKADILKQIESFQNEGFLTRGNLNYDYETNVGDRLRTLFKVRDNILDIFGGSMPFDSGKGETAESNLKLAMGKWLSYGTKDRFEFYKWLKKKGWLNNTENTSSGKWIQTALKQIAHKNVDDPNWQEVYTISDGSISYLFTNTDGVNIKTAAYWSGLKSNYNAGEKVEITLTIKLENDKWNTSIYPVYDEAFAGIINNYKPDQTSYSFSRFSNSAGNNSVKCSVGKSGDTDLTNRGETTTISGTFPSEGKEGDEIAVIVESSKGCQAIYVYRWTSNKK